jgi:hypothetical protein
MLRSFIGAIMPQLPIHVLITLLTERVVPEKSSPSNWATTWCYTHTEQGHPPIEYRLMRRSHDEDSISCVLDS